MKLLRTMGLLGTAILTMGSGGVSQTTSDQDANTLEPEYVDTQPAADADATASGTTARAGDGDTESAIVTAANGNQRTSSVPVPRTASEMAEDGRAIELALSDDYIQGRYYTGGGLLGLDEATGHVGVYFSDNRDFVGNIGLMTDRYPLFVEGLSLSVGGRGYLALLSDPNDDVIGFAPGVEGRFGLPYDIPLALVGNIFYSPDILTLGDAEDIIDIDARVEAEVVTDIVGFIGFREFRFDSDDGDDTKAASEIQVGARFAL